MFCMLYNFEQFFITNVQITKILKYGLEGAMTKFIPWRNIFSL